MRRHWLRWKAEKLFARIVILPIIILLLPFTTLGHWLGTLYYRLK